MSLIAAFALGFAPLAEAAPPAEEAVIPTAGEHVRQVRAEDAVSDFFGNGEARGLRHAVTIDPTSGASVSFTRAHHHASETVTIDGVTVASKSGSEVVWTVSETNERGAVTTTTRRFSSGDMPSISLDSHFDW